jgi:dipeptidyl aminopeptidase/acylaminoacyl peptidase
LAQDGTPLQGLLFTPEGFDGVKKFPMMVYFYERNSETLHNYRPPAPSRSTINIPYFVSNDYVVFVPDIKYDLGLPGPSAYDCIMPGVQAVVALGGIDKENMAIQGQSWGGYQVAYLMTRTNLFKAAGAGAPVVNMTSAYGGIRWGTGMSRMFQYEQTQSRIGGTLWEKPLYFLENSPLFTLDRVNTPVLIMHNDADGSVPWYQGIEMFMGLKRLNKPAWLLQYNGEDHNLVQRKNAKDLSIRLSQFFDHYLKGAPAPLWMTEGLPAVEKGRTLKYELGN